MGIVCFSHGEAKWSYREFMGFRQKIIDTLYPKAKLSFVEVNAIGSLHPISKEPIYPFLIHSDYQGDMSIEEMTQILPQLIYIVTGWAEVHDNSGEGYYKTSGLELIKGMEEAIEKNEPFKFM